MSAGYCYQLTGKVIESQLSFQLLVQGPRMCFCPVTFGVWATFLELDEIDVLCAASDVPCCW